MRLKIKRLAFSPLLLALLLFQNCSEFKASTSGEISTASLGSQPGNANPGPTAPTTTTNTNTNTTTSTTVVAAGRTCSFNSLSLNDRQSVPGYLYGDAAKMNTTCAAIASSRACLDGTLTGNAAYQYEDCTDATACRAPRHYTYTLGADAALNCVNTVADHAGFIPLFQVSIPDTGKAIAQVKLSAHSIDSIPDFWAAYALVGVPVTPGQTGDDICPGHTVTNKSVIGSGTLTAGAQTVQVYAAHGSDGCTNGQVSVLAGATLDVWVEDPAAACQGQDIGIVDNAGYFVWPTAAVPVASLAIPATTNRTQLTVISSAEGTPLDDPNKVCGQESSTIVAQVVSGSQVNTMTGVITASGGMGHLVLGPELDNVPYSSATMTNAVLNVGANFSSSVVYSGGPTSGGSILAFIKH